MNTSTMELNLNEMEQVNGGGFGDTVAASIATEIELHRGTKACIGYEPYVFGGFNGLCKGLWKGIFGGNCSS